MSRRRPEFQHSKTVDAKDVVPLVNPHLLSLVEVPDRVVRVTVDPDELMIHPKRFDIMAKFIYARHLEMGIGSEWAAHLYAEHIRAFNDFSEGDRTGKIGREAFFDSFHDVLNSIRCSGFDESRSLIPITPDGRVIDGAHRVAACALYRQPVACVQLDANPCYDYRFFSSRGLEEKWLDAIAIEHCLRNRRTHLAIVYPSADGQDSEIERRLEACGGIVYRKDLLLTHRGPVNLIRHIYRDEPWLGSWDNRFAGAVEKARCCFKGRRPTRIFVFEVENLDRARKVKDEIRALFGIGNHSIHINDTRQEKARLAGILFNHNSVHFLNHCQPRNFENYLGFVDEYRRWLELRAVDLDCFCIDGSSVMSAYGIRDAADLDFIHFGHDGLTVIAPQVNSHNTELHHHTLARDDIIFDPDHHFFNDGLKFASLKAVRDMKRKRAEGKDIDDIALIDSFIARKAVAFHAIEARRAMRDTLARLRASRLMLPARFAKRAVMKCLRIAAEGVDRLRPFTRTLNYRGFEVSYSRGTSIIERVKEIGGFEEDKIRRIVQDLEGVEKPVIVDVGANIGLVSLDILARVPECRIYAFEPGPHQASLFFTTIQRNRIADRVELYQLALGDTEGEVEFTVHETRHASGDGFRDTGRAGPAERITVKVDTADGWWVGAGRPKVTLMKIDTEGAELMVLRGAERMISHSRPLIYLEVNAVNLRPYPYDASDILEWLLRHGYTLETLDGDPVEKANLTDSLQEAEDFVAVPIPGSVHDQR